MDIETALSRGVEQILPSRKGLETLMKKRKIRLYQGFDPSSDKLHIGNLIGIRKLAQFQELGHKVIFLIGDFTGMIGDPTDKTAARRKLTKKQVLQNAKDYQKQIASVLRFEGKNAAEIKYNSGWLAQLSFEEVIELTSNFTVQQLLERDFFQERMKRKKPIYLHEFMYPVMQGYDSVAMEVDLEIGGNDQLFNMMAGRSLLKAVKNKEKYVLTMKLLTDPSGRKMGKSEGNTINLTDTANEIFGKMMALPDNLIASGMELLTDLEIDHDSEMTAMEMKKLLAQEMVAQLYGSSEAKRAREEFERAFQKGGLPKKIKEIKVDEGKMALLDLIFEIGGGSRSEIKRLIKARAVDVDSHTSDDPQKEVKISKKGVILKIGKKKYIRVSLK